MADLDELGGIAHGAGGILKQHLLLGLAHQAEELAGLGVIIAVILAEIPAVRRTGQIQGRILVFGLLLPFAKAVGLVADGGAVIAIHAHLPVAVGGMCRGMLGAVDRDLVVIDTQAVALGIAIGEEAALQHLIR